MFLTAFPLWLAGILLVGLPTLVAMSGPILIRRQSAWRGSARTTRSLASSSRPSAYSSPYCWRSQSSSCGRNSAMPRTVSRKKPVPQRRGFTFFFATESLRAQTMMTGALTALIFSGLLIIVAIEHPFAGTVKVTPEPLALVLHEFGSALPPSSGSSRQ